MYLPVLRPDQLEIATHPAKIKNLACGRRWGKTVTGGTCAGVVFVQGGAVAWVAPTYKNTRPLWRWLHNAMADDIKRGRVRSNKTELTLEGPNGGYLALFSGDNIDAMRGDAFHLVVGDEAARLSEYAVYDVIMPTLADYDGDLLLISTPQGKNWWYTLWLQGMTGADPRVASWQRPSWDNPLPQIREAAERARRLVPELTYQQEWAAQFVDAGTIFRNIDACATLPVLEHPDPDRERGYYVIAVDWGKFNDFTVIGVFEVRSRSLIYLERINRIDYVRQAERVRDLANWWQARYVVTERTSQSDAILDLLARFGLHVAALQLTGPTKQLIIEELQIAFEFEQIKVLNHPVLKAELMAYEAKRTPTGRLRFGAPEGMHDDCVMMLALGWHYIRDDPATGAADVQAADPWAVRPHAPARASSVAYTASGLAVAQGAWGDADYDPWAVRLPA